MAAFQYASRQSAVNHPIPPTQEAQQAAATVAAETNVTYQQAGQSPPQAKQLRQPIIAGAVQVFVAIIIILAVAHLLWYHATKYHGRFVHSAGAHASAGAHVGGVGADVGGGVSA